MKIMYCWKCKDFVPMLEEHEFEEYSKIYLECVKAVKNFRIRNNSMLDSTPIDELYAPALDKYRELTGFQGADAFHLWQYHRTWETGPPCTDCGKHLRTPKSKKCFECGNARQ